jgi:hypothetical protein
MKSEITPSDAQGGLMENRNGPLPTGDDGEPKPPEEEIATSNLSDHSAPLAPARSVHGLTVRKNDQIQNVSY